MDAIYAMIREHPEAALWFFAIINGLWLCFTYFNTQRHDRRMEALRHGLSLEAERRAKIYELKAAQYEAYVSNLDAFGKKHQVDMPARINPVLGEFLRDFVAASDDKEREREAIAQFSDKVADLMREVLEDYLRLQHESNGLKLTASESMLATFDELEAAMERSWQKSNEFLKHFIEIAVSQDEEAMARHQRESAECGKTVNDLARKLMRQMREDLAQI